MADEQQAQPAADAQNQNQVDPAFFDTVNEYLELTNKQSKQHGERRISLASMYAAARFNAHVYLANVKPIHAAGERQDFLFAEGFEAALAGTEKAGEHRLKSNLELF